MEIEVRCCCDCHLIGWLPAPASLMLGAYYCFELEPEPGKADEREVLTFQCAQLKNPFVENNWLALKSRDYPIEQLRRIPGFVEAPEEMDLVLFDKAVGKAALI